MLQTMGNELPVVNRYGNSSTQLRLSLSTHTHLSSVNADTIAQSICMGIMILFRNQLTDLRQRQSFK